MKDCPSATARTVKLAYLGRPVDSQPCAIERTLTLTRVLIAVESGNIADELSAQKPFAANEGFAFEATFNCANASRHPAGVGEGW